MLNGIIDALSFDPHNQPQQKMYMEGAGQQRLLAFGVGSGDLGWLLLAP